jgi:hypothetical protein
VSPPRIARFQGPGRCPAWVVGRRQRPRPHARWPPDCGRRPASRVSPQQFVDGSPVPDNPCSLPAMNNTGVLHPEARTKLPASGWAGALSAMALVCAGCGTSASAGNSQNGQTGTLNVTVIQAGGPELPGGGTPKQPVAHAEVKVTSASTSLSSATGEAGVATFRLPSGSYQVSVATCGATGNRQANVTAGASTSLTWTCPVP